MGLGDVAKRIALGRPLRSDRMGDTLLPKRLALPVFASDALSSVAYATEEILLVLSAAGTVYYGATAFIAIGVALLMFVVVLSYRQNVHAYPSGGGDFEVATTNLGPQVGMVVAAALMIDYVLTVAVSVASGVANLTSAVTALQGHEVALSVGIVAVIMLLNLRGLKEAGTAFAVPTYAFVLGVVGLLGYGAVQFLTGGHPQAESAGFGIRPEATYAGLGLAFLMLRAFASGCTALTGVEAISNGVPSFEKPKSKNAATTLALLGGIAVSMFAGVTALALGTHVHVVDAASGGALTGAPAGYTQRTVIAQVSAAVFGSGSPLFYYLQFVTALILVLAANTAFNGFPTLASILAQASFLPRQLRNRGDRLIFSNGVVLLAGFAIVLIVAFHASPTRLIQLYIVGVFVSFVCSQNGMIRHWNRLLRTERDPAARTRMMRSRVVNAVGAGFTGAVLAIVLVTKFTRGAYIVVITMPILFLLMRSIYRYYKRVSEELLPPPDMTPVLPSRVHAVVLVSKIHRPTLRAVAYAKATHPHTLEALTVATDAEEAEALESAWRERGLDKKVPLRILSSPYRDVTKPVLDHIAGIRRQSPGDIVVVYIPEYVVGHWWEQLLHNQTPLRIKARLLFQPGVMVTSVPYQLESSHRRLHPDAPAGGPARYLREQREAAAAAQPRPEPGDEPGDEPGNEPGDEPGTEVADETVPARP